MCFKKWSSGLRDHSKRLSSESVLQRNVHFLKIFERNYIVLANIPIWMTDVEG